MFIIILIHISKKIRKIIDTMFSKCDIWLEDRLILKAFFKHTHTNLPVTFE